jgi:Cu/Ag efflux protein CusF
MTLARTEVRMRKLIPALTMAAGIAVGGSLAAIAQAAPADGQVTKIDEAAARITLKHGPISNLDMGAMTMVFRVKDPALLKSLKVGDRVKFEAERVDGAITVTRIEKAR